MASAAVAQLMADPVAVTRIADGAYHAEHEGRHEVVYIAGSPGDRWAFWHGHVFHDTRPASNASTGGAPARTRRAYSGHALTAPMPAAVIKVLVTPGSTVKKGDTVILLEAMKMELPLRALADATVRAVHCREGELVQPDATLIELE